MALYDAFISYSHALDKPIASALQSVIQRLGKPWYRRRALRVFRDDTSLSATPHLWQSIEEALGQSRYLVLLASSEAAASPWVSREIEYWLEHKSVDTILIALTDGALVWDHATNDFGGAENPLPAVLKGRFPTEPKWVDVRPYRAGVSRRDPGFMEAGANLAAAIHGMPKEDLLSQEVRQQRRALSLAWSATSLLLVLAGLAVWQWRVATVQRDRAERSLAAATHTADTLIFDLAQEFRRRTGMPAELTRTILQRVQELQTQLAQSGERTPELRRLESVALDELYSAFVVQGDRKGALATAERSRTILTQLVREFPQEMQYRRDLAVTINNIGDARFALGETWETSLALYRDALAVVERLAAINPNSASYQRDLAACLNKVADMLAVGGNHDDALAAYQRSLAVLDKLVATDPANRRLQADISFTYNRIGFLLASSGKSSEALSAYRTAVSIREKLAAAEPDNTDRQRDLFTSLIQSGSLLVSQAQADEALATYRKALGIIERLVASDASNTSWQRDLSVAHDQVGDLLFASGQHEAALESYRKSLAVRQKLQSSNPDFPLWQRDAEVSLNKIGDVYLAVGRRDEALESYKAALAIASKLSESRPDNTDWQHDMAICFNKIGDAHLPGDPTAARAAYLNALAISERLTVLDPTKPLWQRDLSFLYDRLGNVFATQGKRISALAIYRKGLAVRENLAATDPGNLQWLRDVASSHDRIGGVLLDSGLPDDARDHYRTSLVMIETLTSKNPGNAAWQIDLALSLYKLAMLGDDAKPRLVRALVIVRRLDGERRLSANQKSWIDHIEGALGALP